MVSGFFGRVLLLSLLAFWQHVNARSYRGGGSSGIKPYFDMAHDDQPASARAGFAQLSDSVDTERGPGFYGKRPDSYSPLGSVSRYRPRSLISPKTRKPPQVIYDQTNAGVLQTKAGMWDFSLPQNGKKFQPAIVSSPPIEMSYPAKPQPQPQQQPRYPAKPQQQPRYPAKPQPQPQPQQQPRYPAKPRPQPQPQQQPRYPAKPQQQPSYLQSKDGMWDFALDPNQQNANPRSSRPAPMAPRSYRRWRLMAPASDRRRQP